MAIREYQSETGEKLWKVYVCIRSRENPSIRIQRYKFGCKTEKQAVREEVNLLRECQIEVSKQEARGSTWGAVVDSWASYLEAEGSASIDQTTRSDYVLAVRKFTREWMDRSASSITRLNVREVLTQVRVQGCTPGFQKKIKNLINRVFIFGIESRMIKGLDQSPAVGVQLDKPEEKKPEILTTGQIRTLLVEARRLESPWYSVWAMALLTGMRSGELYALQWSDVNWENNSISVDKSYNGRMKCIKCTKSGHCRTVPVSSELMTLLREIKSHAGDRPSILHHSWKWTKGYQAVELRKFCLGIGIPSVRFHALRACFATQLIQNGVPPIMVQKICGWRDLKTMQRYIRMAGIEIEGATESLRVLPAVLPSTVAETAEKASELFMAKVS